MLLLAVLLAVLLVGSCRRATAPGAAEPSHIRIEPSRPPDDPLRKQPVSGTATPEEVGIEFYPGATIQESSLGRDGRGVTAAVRLRTRDAYADVLNFYSERYRTRAQVVKLDGPEGHAMAFNWATPSANFTVEVKQDVAGKQTLVHLVRLTGKARPPEKTHR
jgi:hypothetical protein